jgi:hypothetical protein
LTVISTSVLLPRTANEFNEQGYGNASTSLLLLWWHWQSDYDSFSELGGDEFVQRAMYCSGTHRSSGLRVPTVEVSTGLSRICRINLLPYRKGFYTIIASLWMILQTTRQVKEGQVLWRI